MSNELQEIRRLLTTPSPENVGLANSALESLPSSIAALRGLSLAQPALAALVLESLAEFRSRISDILSLSRAASDYFRSLVLLRASGFGAYERTGALKSLDTSPRTIAQL